MNTYLLFKSLHIISFVAWMAGIFYLPRLFVYHTRATIGSEMDQTFQVMERKLLYAIMYPAMIATIIFGIALMYEVGIASLTGWFHAKATCVILLVIYQYYLGLTRVNFANGRNQKSETFFRVLNEVPTVVLIAIVVLVVFKPF